MFPAAVRVKSGRWNCDKWCFWKF